MELVCRLHDTCIYVFTSSNWQLVQCIQNWKIQPLTSNNRLQERTFGGAVNKLDLSCEHRRTLFSVCYFLNRYFRWISDDGDVKFITLFVMQKNIHTFTNQSNDMYENVWFFVMEKLVLRQSSLHTSLTKEFEKLGSPKLSSSQIAHYNSACILLFYLIMMSSKCKPLSTHTLTKCR